MTLDERRPRGPAAERFPGQRSAACKKVQHVGADHAIAYQVEHSLAHALFHGTRARVARVGDRTTAERPADDAQCPADGWVGAGGLLG